MGRCEYTVGRVLRAYHLLDSPLDLSPGVQGQPLQPGEPPADLVRVFLPPGCSCQLTVTSPWRKLGLQGNICMLLDYIINCSHEQLIFKKEKGGEKRKGKREKGEKEKNL